MVNFYLEGDENSYITKKSSTNSLILELGRLKQSQIHYYTVTASANNGKYTSTSDKVKVLVAPLAPTADSATDITESGFKANWSISARDNVTVKYRIELSNGTVEETSEKSFVFTGLEPATEYSYTVKAINENGLESSDSKTITLTTAGDRTAVSETSASNVNLYPNPATDYIVISGIDIQTVRIHTATGRLVGKYEEDRIDVSGLQSGVYHAIVTTQDGKNIAKTFIKQ